MSILSTKVLALLNKQYHHELKNHLRYINRASWADRVGLTGTASFFRKQAHGEAEHATQVLDFIEARSMDITPEQISAEPFPKDLPGIFETAMAIERETTQMLKEISVASFAENDLQTFYWIADLVKEQTEEENITQTILDRIKVRGTGDPAAEHDMDVWIGSLA